jgi:excisionase family DNA binding protein
MPPIAETQSSVDESAAAMPDKWHQQRSTSCWSPLHVSKLNQEGGMPMHESPSNSNNAADRPPVLLTIEEARAVLRISRWSLYQLINRQRLKTIRIGHRRLIDADDLRALLDELRREGADHER